MRRSTGEVKLRKTPNGFAFTVPELLDLAIQHLEGKKFMASYHHKGDVEEIVFTRKRTFRLKIGGK